MMLIGAVFYPRHPPRPVRVFGALPSLVGVAWCCRVGDPAAIARIKFVEATC